MPRYNLYLEEPGSSAPTRVLLYVHWNGHRLKYPTGCKVLPVHWSEQKQRATGHVPTCRKCSHPPTDKVNADGIPVAVEAHREINERLGYLLAVATSTVEGFAKDQKRVPTREELRMALMRAEQKSDQDAPLDLLGYIRAFIGQAETRINEKSKKRLHRATRNRYAVTLAYLEAFIAKGRNVSKVRELPFAAVDGDFLRRFAAYLTTERTFAANTVAKYMHTLRMFLNRAKEDGHGVNHLALSRRLTFGEEATDAVYLTAEELEDFYRVDLSAHPRLDRARDLFLVGAWTGLRFGDLSTVQPEHIQGDKIRVRTSKTGREVVIPLHPVVRAIMGKYGGRIPSGISNQKQNDYVKEAAASVPSLQVKVMTGRTVGGMRVDAARCKSELITTHTARRSYASNFYRAGTPARTIMAITGHTTEQAFLRYIRLTDEEHADMIAGSELFNRPMMKAV